MSNKINISAVIVFFAAIISVEGAGAQSTDALIRSGNRLYKKKQTGAALQQYQDAVKKDPANPTANYNLGNSQFRENKFDEAANSYDATAKQGSGKEGKELAEKGLYNKGVAMVKQKKLPEGIDAWKSALKIDPADEDARENLEKALREQKQQQQQQQKNKKDQQKDQKDKNQKDDKKKQDQQQQPEQPKPQPSRLNKQQVEQLLKALQQKENEIQDKVNLNKVRSVTQPEKDW